ncbi:MAG: hypothetical protein JWO62_226 [Acidimicrobiaceae bacterium]|nr:hypothetical protein [Acidimicrobiaceae bacterium]
MKVPTERVAEFYTMVGRWLSGEMPPTQEQAVRFAVEPWGTTHHDKKVAVQVLNRLTAPAKRMFEVLSSEPGKPIEAEELARLADIPNGRYGIAGALAWPTRRFAEMERPLPVESDQRPEGTVYWIEEHLAPMILNGVHGVVPAPPRRAPKRRRLA